MHFDVQLLLVVSRNILDLRENSGVWTQGPVDWHGRPFLFIRLLLHIVLVYQYSSIILATSATRLSCVAQLQGDNYPPVDCKGRST